MKLDSEEQRKDLIEIISTVRISTTLGTVEETLAEANRILDPIRYAEIEADMRPVVPIESLAPDYMKALP